MTNPIQSLVHESRTIIINDETFLKNVHHEAFASEWLKHIEYMCPWYYMHTD